MNEIILVLDDLGEKAHLLLKNSPYHISFDKNDIAKADAFIVRSTAISKELITSAPHLKIISRAGVGMDNIDTDFAHSLGIFTFNANGGNSVNAAETTIGLILSLAHKISYAHQLLYGKKKWERGLETEGFELEGKTLGIVGCGNVGSRVVNFAHAFNMNILVYDPYITQFPSFATPVPSLQDILTNSDIVSLHTPLTEETLFMIDKKELSLMKKNAYLVNASRGKIVSEKALVHALKNHIIAGAALDVFEQEPLPSSSELFSLKNITMIPHLGGAGIECRNRVSLLAVQQVLNKLQEL